MFLRRPQRFCIIINLQLAAFGVQPMSLKCRSEQFVRRYMVNFKSAVNTRPLNGYIGRIRIAIIIITEISIGE